MKAVRGTFRWRNNQGHPLADRIYGASSVRPHLFTKLEVLSEANCSLMLCIGVVVLYELASIRWPILHSVAPSVLIIGLFALFLLSYKKQTTYIAKRIEANKQLV